MVITRKPAREDCTWLKYKQDYSKQSKQTSTFRMLFKQCTQFTHIQICECIRSSRYIRHRLSNPSNHILPSFRQIFILPFSFVLLLCILGHLHNVPCECVVSNQILHSNRDHWAWITLSIATWKRDNGDDWCVCVSLRTRRMFGWAVSWSRKAKINRHLWAFISTFTALFHLHLQKTHWPHLNGCLLITFNFNLTKMFHVTKPRPF